MPPAGCSRSWSLRCSRSRACCSRPARAADPRATVPAPAASGPLRLELTELTPRVVTADGPPTVTVTGTLRNTGDRPGRRPRDPAAARRGAAHRGRGARRAGRRRPHRRRHPASSSRCPARWPRAARCRSGSPCRCAAPRPTASRWTSPGSTRCSSTSTGCRADGARARLAAVRLLLPVLSLPPGPQPGRRRGRCPTVPRRRRRSDRALPAGRHAAPAADGARRADAAHRRRARPVAGAAAAGSAGWSRRSPRGRRRVHAVRDATCLAVDPGPRRDGRGDAAGLRGARAGRHGARHRCRGRRHLAGHAGGGRPRRLRRRAALRRRRPRRAHPRAARRPGPARRSPTRARWSPRPSARRCSRPPPGPATACSTSRRSTPSPRAAPARWCSPPARWTAARRGRPAGRSRSPSARRRCSRCSPTPCWPARPPAPDTPTRAVARRRRPRSRRRRARRWPPRTRSPPSCSAPRTRRSGQPVVLAPPHVWSTDATGARALLAAVDLLLDSGRMQARGLADVVAAGPTTPGAARRPADPLQAGSREIPPAVLDVGPRDARRRARPALGRRARRPGSAPRSTRRSTRCCRPRCAPPRRPGTAGRTSRRSTAASAATRIAELRDSVRVLEPPSPYSLGTSDAPLLLTVANGLPVTMEVRVSISSTTGLRVAPIPPQRIPPLGRRQVQVSAEVVRSGQFSVEATVHSPAGRALGPPSRLQVRSTAYGTITVWLTGTAGGAARRPGGAPGGAPDPGRGEPARPDRPGGGAAEHPAPPRSRWPRHRGSGNGAAEPHVVGPAHTGSTPDSRPPGTPDDAGPDPARPGTPDPSGTGPPPVTPDRRAAPPPGTVARPGQQPDGGGQPGQPDHRVPAADRAGRRARPGRGQRLLHGRQHAAQHRLRAAARRRADQRDGPAAGPRADRGRRRRRGLHPAAAHRGGRGPAVATLAAMAPRRCSPASTSATAPARPTRSWPPRSPSCCCRRSSSTASARCSARSSTAAACSAPFAWAPVLNNVVVLAVLGVFVAVPGEITARPGPAERPEAAGPRDRHDARHRRAGARADARRCAGPGSATGRCGAGTGGSPRPAGWPSGSSPTS